MNFAGDNVLPDSAFARDKDFRVAKSGTLREAKHLSQLAAGDDRKGGSGSPPRTRL
jgi:hypothetical protein